MGQEGGIPGLDPISISDDIEVERPRGIGDRSHPPGFRLKPLELSEEVGRRQIARHFDNAVHIPGLIIGARHRRRLIPGRASPDRDATRRKIGDSLFQCSDGTASRTRQIGTQAYIDLLSHPCSRLTLISTPD